MNSINIIRRAIRVPSGIIRNYSSSNPKQAKTDSFLSSKNIGIEVTPLIVFVTIAAGSSITFLIHHAFKDEELRLKPGQSHDTDDEELKKVLAQK